MTKPKKFRVGQVVYCKLDKGYVRLVCRHSGRDWWVVRGTHIKWSVSESEIRPLTKRESAK